VARALIITTPIRPVPTDFPPIGSLSIVSYVRRHGAGEIDFYNIDANRPRFEEAVDFIVRFKPDVLGISAVVSTAYEYTKKISLAIKERLPNILIVVGGNLAASAEILLRRTGTDICVLGEGERVFADILRRADTTLKAIDYADIPGLALIDAADTVRNTGYPPSLSRDEVYDIDWSILELTSPISHYICGLHATQQALRRFNHDPRTFEPKRAGKTNLLFPTAKGCVARCTFCHRWDKGIRYIPVDTVIERLKYLIDRHNVGFVNMADENFGTDHRWLRELCEKIKPLDILWRVGGMRVNCVTPELIAMMKDAGCCSIVYGMESGSPRILQVMEKKTKQEDNLNAMRWTVGAGLSTVVQLVLGMPGESPETIQETIEFTRWAVLQAPDQNPNNLSVNYAQALPGTPLYEYGRHAGLIGRSLDDEEDYLLRISDKDAHDEFSTLNFTDFPVLETLVWRPRITVETNYAYVRKFGLERYHSSLLKDTDYFSVKNVDDGYYANPKRLVDRSGTADTIHGVKRRYESDDISRVPGLWDLIKKRHLGLAMICYPVLFYRLRAFLPVMVFLKNFRKYSLRENSRILFDYLKFKLLPMRAETDFSHEYKSLRRIVNTDLGELPTDSAAMAPLRKGR